MRQRFARNSKNHLPGARGTGAWLPNFDRCAHGGNLSPPQNVHFLTGPSMFRQPVYPVPPVWARRPTSAVSGRGGRKIRRDWTSLPAEHWNVVERQWRVDTWWSVTGDSHYVLLSPVNRAGSSKASSSARGIPVISQATSTTGLPSL